MADHANYPEDAFSPTRYYDHSFEIEAVKLLPGEYFVTNRDMMLVTVLGSCVAACIRDPVAGIGGMNHFMLPEEKPDPNALVSPAERYGNYAMKMMIDQLLEAGARRENLEAKLFGGGNVLRGFTVTHGGERNVDFAMRYLQKEGICIVATSLLDIYPRKIYYFPASGRVMLKTLREAHNDTIIEREAEYHARIRLPEIQLDLDMF